LLYRFFTKALGASVGNAGNFFHCETCNIDFCEVCCAKNVAEILDPVQNKVNFINIASSHQIFQSFNFYAYSFENFKEFDGNLQYSPNFSFY
jgi:hypothetical protein